MAESAELAQTGASVANIYYDPGAARAAKVQALFSRIAPRYDLINDVQSLGLHRLWKRRVIQLARPRPGEHALDLCCGTGDLALALARRGAQVIGLDFNERMLAAAKRRAAAFRPRAGTPRMSPAVDLPRRTLPGGPATARTRATGGYAARRSRRLRSSIVAGRSSLPASMPSGREMDEVAGVSRTPYTASP